MFFKLFHNLKYQALCSSILMAIQCLFIKCHKDQGLTHKVSHKISHFFVFLRKVIIFKMQYFSKKKLKKLKKKSKYMSVALYDLATFQVLQQVKCGASRLALTWTAFKESNQPSGGQSHLRCLRRQFLCPNENSFRKNLCHTKGGKFCLFKAIFYFLTPIFNLIL